jgi:xanthine dehydrogenase accessory factor
MDRSSDIEVLRNAVEWLENDEAITLVTVADTWGSSPRRPGSLMAINADGRFSGSVSGGCVEDDLVQRVMKGEFDDVPPRLLQYGVGAKQLQKTGLPCGGRLTVLAEHIESPLQLRQVLQSMDAKQQLRRQVSLTTGETHLLNCSAEDTFHFDGNTLIKTFGPGLRLLIIGAGELARRVAQLALTLDYVVTLCDPRPEYAHHWQVEGAHFVSTSPRQTVADFQPDRHSAVLALSHTPVMDDAALASALQSDAFYVGALGSLTNQAARRKRLRQQGLSVEQLERLHGPVGLDIGSRTPSEIAIAIIAGLIAERNQQRQSQHETQSAYG